MKITAPIFRLTVGVLSLMLAVPCDGEIEFFVHVDANVTHVWCGACRRAVSDLAQPFAGRNTVDSAVDSRTASAAFCRQEYMLSTQRSTLVQRWQETGWPRSALLAFRFFLSQLLVFY